MLFTIILCSSVLYAHGGQQNFTQEELAYFTEDYKIIFQDAAAVMPDPPSNAIVSHDEPEDFPVYEKLMGTRASAFNEDSCTRAIIRNTKVIFLIVVLLAIVLLTSFCCACGYYIQKLCYFCIAASKRNVEARAIKLTNLRAQGVNNV